MGTWSYRPSTITIPATTADTYTHADEQLPKGGIGRFTLVHTGAANSIAGAGISAYRVKVNSVPLYDLTGPQLRALLEGLRSRLGAAIPATTDLRFTIPLDLVELLAGAPCGIPFGVSNSVEIVTTASSDVGSSRIGWRLHDRQPAYMPQIIRQQMNIGASVTNGRFDIKSGLNAVCGWLLPIVSATGITRLRVVQMVDGKEHQLFHGAQADILESQGYFSEEALITTSFLFALEGPTVFPPGSYLEVDTGAASAAADLIAPVQLLKL